MTKVAHKTAAFIWMGCLWALASYAAEPELIGRGVKFGGSRVHPYVDFEFRYDNSVQYERVAQRDTDRPYGPELVAHVRPGLRMELPWVSSKLRLHGALDYVHYTGVVMPGSQALPRMDGNADLTLSFNENGPFQFQLGNEFVRADRTGQTALGVGLVSLYNKMHLNAVLRPGSGVLEILPKIAWATESFELLARDLTAECVGPFCDENLVSSIGYQNIQVGVDGRWLLLPKTSVLAEAGLDTRRYPRGNFANTSVARMTLGVSSVVSPRVTTLGKVGFNGTVGQRASAAAQAQFETSYLLTEQSVFRAGYLRSLVPTPIYGSYVLERFYFDGQLALGPKMVVRAHIGRDWTHYNPKDTREDDQVSVDLALKHQLTPFIALTGGYVLGVRSSTLPSMFLNYSRHETYVRATLSY